ncbi:Com family DNA-binding transcriptional regulator [Vibrio parahaemolyticus]|nr:Com family DNA-binding transcriptional regulator [Vibrio parahaemolyticus]MBD6979011.1 Com family DNA-binding transcriptional regulator [Vibrio parahaemolyticus]MBD6991773.1 Com family DNA-binding transcriptional regulator [Vibrio parahaemolyticus]
MTLLKELRCPYCGKLLCKLDGAIEIKCNRCKKIVERKSATSA